VDNTHTRRYAVEVGDYGGVAQQPRQNPKEKRDESLASKLFDKLASAVTGYQKQY
jgi:hypothetical protein